MKCAQNMPLPRSHMPAGRPLGVDLDSTDDQPATHCNSFSCMAGTTSTVPLLVWFEGCTPVLPRTRPHPGPRVSKRAGARYGPAAEELATANSKLK